MECRELKVEQHNQKRLREIVVKKKTTKTGEKMLKNRQIRAEK